jgi:hypothetical protein
MDRLLRWCIASTVTVVVFATGTWVGGVMVLPHMVGSFGTRWAIAPAFGVAVAALAVLWAAEDSDCVHHRARRQDPPPTTARPGAAECLFKPFSEAALLDAVRAALRRPYSQPARAT